MAASTWRDRRVRIGYAQYLRTARTPEVAAIAFPGLAGLVLLTAAGGVVGYRQGSASAAVRPNPAQRYLP